MADTSKFLEDLNDNKMLCQIVMPGSHDAGVYGGSLGHGGVGLKSWARCQSGSLSDQCLNGSRFFDLRVKQRSSVFGKSKLRAFHGAVKGGNVLMGNWGADIGTMLQDVKSFLTSNPSEFVILRFSKSNHIQDLLHMIRDTLGDKLYAGSGNIAATQIGRLRGKAITIFETGMLHKGKAIVEQWKGTHNYQKYGAEGSSDTRGLICCGSYAKSIDIGKVYGDQLQKYRAHAQHSQGDHLHVLYWTQTHSKGGSVKKATLGSEGARENFGNFRQSLVNNIHLQQVMGRGIQTHGFVQAAMPNIVMYDFVNSESSAEIIKLNEGATLNQLKLNLAGH